jgi:hypothetical protein
MPNRYVCQVTTCVFSYQSKVANMEIVTENAIRQSYNWNTVVQRVMDEIHVLYGSVDKKVLVY